MAAPESKTARDLNGVWFMNKTISDDADPALALQGISWLTRTAISLASVTAYLKQYEDDSGITHIDIDTKLTGGINGTTELRTLNWQATPHQDHIFGPLKGKSHFTTIADLRKKSSGEAKAAGDASSTGDAVEASDVIDAEDISFLCDGWEKAIMDGAEVVETFSESETNGWTARQIWGFEDVQVGENVERRYTRHVVIRKGSEVKRLRLVYDWLPQ